jgi:hypothetical protein
MVGVALHSAPGDIAAIKAQIRDLEQAIAGAQSTIRREPAAAEARGIRVRA